MKLIYPCCALAALLFAAGCNPSSDTTSTSSGAASDSQNLSSGKSASSETRMTDTNASQLPDNTGKNVRDRSDATLTSGDQGESKADVEVNSKIRRALTSNDQLSTDAKNIKIVTQNGKVTLRGPVKTEEERKAIASVAQQEAGTATIDNQLEVKAANQ